jgi:hypothetical protein
MLAVMRAKVFVKTNQAKNLLHLVISMCFIPAISIYKPAKASWRITKRGRRTAETKISEVQVIATIGTILVWTLIVVAAPAGHVAFIGFMFLSAGQSDADC